MRFHHLIAIATVALIAQVTANQHTFDVLEPVLTPDLTDIVQEIIDTHQIPGLALAIVRKNGHSEFGTWGKKSEDGSRVTEDGGNTTPLPTGLSTLSWQTKLADILPGDWELSDPWASEKANLIDILSHVSGLPRHDLAYKRNHSTLNVTRNLRNLRPSHELREKFSYNNQVRLSIYTPSISSSKPNEQMYMVGAHVITVLSGIQFTEFVKDRIFRPLKMTRSTYSIDEAIQSGKASETWTAFGRRIPPWMEGRDNELIAGPGGLISNVKELASWVKLFLNDGVDLDTNATIIPRGAFETMTSAHQILSGYPTELSATIVGYGLGWMRSSMAGHDLLYHGGDAPGVSADIVIPVLDDVGIIALASASTKRSALREVTVTVLRKLALAGCADEKMPTNLSAHASTRFQFAASSSRRAREEDPSTTHEIPRRDLTGTYEDAGYGTFTLCDASSRSDECRSVLDDFHLVDGSSADDPNTLFASWPSFGTSHARFNPTNTTGRYLVDFGSLYPTGYGRNTTPFADWLDRGPADFVVEDGVVRGFGFSGMGEREGYGSVEENFEVWFTTANQHTFDVLEPVLTPDLTDIVQDIVDTHQIPGLALAVVRKNGHSEFGTWGKQSEDGSRVTEDTLFNIGSCSKAFVAASLGILIEEFAQGRNTTPLPTGLSTLSWQTKLADILPGDWGLSDSWASKKANLIDILSHVSGMPSHDLAYKRDHSTLDVTRNLRNLRPSYELREKFSYNNQMYMVAAHVITALSGIQFTEFVKDRILRPLKMTQSTYSINDAIQSGKASETWTAFGRR
ncbi:beta-lactamase/transpeptidase-like protein, partial [Lactarius hatsudake]